MATNNNSGCPITVLSPRTLADASIMVVDWAYYSDSANNHFSENVTPDGSQGCTPYPQGQVPQLSNGKRTERCILTNNSNDNLCFVELPPQVFGKGRGQCDQLIYHINGSNDWLLLLELKYSAPITNKSNRGSYTSNLQKKYEKAALQINDTYKHISSCDSCEETFPKIICGVVSFPRIPDIKGQSHSIRKVDSKVMEQLAIKRLPEIVNSISIADLPKKYRVDVRR